MDWCGAAGLVMGISGLMFFLGIVAGGGASHSSSALIVSGLASLAGFILFYRSEKHIPTRCWICPYFPNGHLSCQW